jgi:hypothetical protein
MLNLTAHKDYHFCYLIEQGVCYLTLADKNFPKKLTFQFLDAVAREFSDAHQHEVSRFSRPFAAVSFGKFTALPLSSPELYLMTWCIAAWQPASFW